MSDPSAPHSENTPPVLKKRTLLTGVSAASNAGPKLVSEAEQAAALPRARFLTPAMKQQIEEEQAQQVQQDSIRIEAEQEAARIAAEQEAARLAAEQEAARIAAEQEAARFAAEQEAARIAAEQEAARFAAEQEAARITAEQEAARFTAQQASTQQPATTNTAPQDGLDPKIQAALDQIRLAQEALAAAQQQAMEMVSLASSAQTQTSFSPSPEAPAPAPAPAPEPEKKTLFKVGGAAQQKETAPKTADSLKEKIAASLNKATSGNTSASEPSSVLPPSMTDPVAQQAPVSIQPLPQVMPEAIWKKKSFKIGMVIAACIAIMSAVLIVVTLKAQEAQRKQNEYITSLCQIGSELGKKAAEIGGTTGSDLKYDAAKYKIKVTPNEKDAKLLLARIGSKEQQGGWESAAHLLGVMGQLDPKIAKIIIDDLGTNTKLYTDAHYMMIISVLSCDKDEKIQKLFPALLAKLEAARQPRKQGIVLKQMRYGMTPNDISLIMKYLTDPKASGEMASAAKECLRSITFNTDASGKATVSQQIISELRKSSNDKDLPPAQRIGLLNALALSGTSEAQAYFQEYIKDKQGAQLRPVLRSLGEWGNDSIVPFLMELRNTPSLVADKSIKGDLDRILLQRLSKDGERSEEQGAALFNPLMDEAEELTKNATEPEAIKEAQMLKMLIVAATGQLKPRPYVTNILDTYKKDSDETVSMSATRAETQMKNKEERSKEPKKSAADKAKEWEQRFNQ